MRLIDADKFKGKVIASHTGSGVIKLISIDEVPTAYDVCKVVEQLKDYAIEFEAFGQCSDYVELSNAIDIVKGGGLND